MGEQLKEVLETIAKGFEDDNKQLQEARERRYRHHQNDRRTTLAYERAIDYEMKADNVERAAWIALEAKKYSHAIEFFSELEQWENAAFAAKVAGKCEAARDLYRKAGNEYFAQRMQENIDSRAA